jgi:hypothetical protein
MDQNLHLYVEDRLSEQVVRRMLQCCWPDWEGAVRSYDCRGNSALRAQMPKIQQSAARLPSFVLTDLDSLPCPSALIAEWLRPPFPSKLIFRVAVREVEAWLLADAVGCAQFLSVSQTHIPRMPEQESDPKRTLINIARRSKKRQIREGIVPSRSTSAPVGPAYNPLLRQFVQSVWNPEAARLHSSSLDRALTALSNRRSISFSEQDT